MHSDLWRLFSCNISFSMFMLTFVAIRTLCDKLKKGEDSNNIITFVLWCSLITQCPVHILMATKFSLKMCLKYKCCIAIHVAYLDMS